MNDKDLMPEKPNENRTEKPEQSDSHPVATGLGAVGGGMAGAKIGGSVGGKLGAVVGSVAGAIAGSILGNTVAEMAEEVSDEVKPHSGLGLGANNKPIELPRHYSWEELQALSKPQRG